MREFAIALAREAGQLLNRYFERKLTITSKTTAVDLLTEADVASERLIVEAIRARYPNHRIMAEESNEGQAEADETLWMIDPLDGTTNYVHGFPVFAVSIAVRHRGELALGVTYDPQRDECFWAERGGGTWLNGRRVRVSQANALGHSLLATGFPYRRAQKPTVNLAEFGRLMPRVQGLRRAGAATLDIAYVAAGRLDGYWEYYLEPWDWAAGVLMVEEAGGQVSEIGGQPWSLGSQNIVASNGRLHGALLEVFGELRRGEAGTAITSR